MKFNKFQKAKIVLGLSSFAFLLAILFIPNLIDHGLEWASEDTIETLFLVLSFLATVYVFWHYDYVVQKREQESSYLSSKLLSKEKELIETFQYLGKVNVRFSVIRDLLDRMKKPAPTSKKELKEALRELLEIACSATGSERIWLKIVDIKTRKILIEKKEGYNFEESDENNKVTVNNLLDVYRGKIDSKINQSEIFYSRSDNFDIKAFLILPANDEATKPGDDFLRAVVNQCEFLFLLFESHFYSSKKTRNEKK